MLMMILTTTLLIHLLHQSEVAVTSGSSHLIEYQLECTRWVWEHLLLLMFTVTWPLIMEDGLLYRDTGKTVNLALTRTGENMKKDLVTSVGSRSGSWYKVCQYVDLNQQPSYTYIYILMAIYSSLRWDQDSSQGLHHTITHPHSYSVTDKHYTYSA